MPDIQVDHEFNNKNSKDLKKEEMRYHEDIGQTDSNTFDFDSELFNNED